ncbi:hypothetical protein [Anaerobiospirillum sp. NML120449]|uniref:hypothetical protein n=1 Tax=Anaerobiospirillum sp. NML120449 TaxID=2932817 RepID=UPI001FF3656E|nr:hypothetical protein [Anaerobiospirillum sp. NML120449]MCK0526348.1 hypothetical protein [Anaerobiospirillum sp. NML120449]
MLNLPEKLFNFRIYHRWFAGHVEKKVKLSPKSLTIFSGYQVQDCIIICIVENNPARAQVVKTEKFSRP